MQTSLASATGVSPWVSTGLYQTRLAARQQAPVQLAEASRDIPSLVLTSDGVQPAKGHETLYGVRARMRKRGWFAEPWLSSAPPEVCRLIVVARQWAERLDKPVRGWMSDQQDAFVKALATEFPGPPHRDCDNHFRRDLAQPVLEMASRAKVKRRRTVRGWRAIERRGLAEQRPAAAPAPPPPDEPSKTAAPPRAAASEAAAPGASSARGLPTAGEAFVEDEEGEVVRG